MNTRDLFDPKHELTDEQLMEALTEADRRWERQKIEGKPLSFKERQLQYEQDHRLC